MKIENTAPYVMRIGLVTHYFFIYSLLHLSYELFNIYIFQMLLFIIKYLHILSDTKNWTKINLKNATEM